ncbi:MAG: CopG family transcriptional regulator [Chryseobacterium sp.]|jgi:hypothetical protein
MAITQRPKSNTSEEEKFIDKASKEESKSPNKIPTMIRVDPDLLKRIDIAAKRLGISRSAFIVLSAAEKLERIEG